MNLFSRQCNKFAACNCGVAVRSGDDVLLFDTCGADGDSPKGLKMSAFVSGELTPGTRVQQFNGGKEYKVIDKQTHEESCFFLSLLLCHFVNKTKYFFFLKITTFFNKFRECSLLFTTLTNCTMMKVC